MALVPQILVCGQFWIDTLRLKYNTDLPPQARSILSHIATHDQSAARGRNHQSGKNSKQSSLAAAIGPEQSEHFGWPNIEGNAIQRGAILITVDKILYGNDRLHGGVLSLRTGINECSDFRDQIGSPETVTSLRHSRRYP